MGWTRQFRPTAKSATGAVAALRLATRQVCFLGCTPKPVSSWMAQMARNLTDAFDGFLRAPLRYVLLDRDAKFTAEFQGILTDAEVKPVLLPPQSPNCNAHIERFFRSLKDEALSRLILFSEAALRQATSEFVHHYHGERCHQGLEHRLLEPGPEAGNEIGVIACRERLGGLLKYYHRQAAWMGQRPDTTHYLSSSQPRWPRAFSAWNGRRVSSQKLVRHLSSTSAEIFDHTRNLVALALAFP